MVRHTVYKTTITLTDTRYLTINNYKVIPSSNLVASVIRCYLQSEVMSPCFEMRELAINKLMINDLILNLSDSEMVPAREGVHRATDYSYYKNTAPGPIGRLQLVEGRSFDKPRSLT